MKIDVGKSNSERINSGLDVGRMESPTTSGKYCTTSSVPYHKERSNLGGSTLNYDEGSSGGSGIDEAEFKTLREESEKIFARNQDECCSAFSFQDVLDTLNTKRVTKNSLLSHVELDPATYRLKLSVDRGNVRAKYGYDVGKEAYLYPEEALYLLETSKAEIFCEHVSLSIQRARSLLLVSQRDEASIGICNNCTVEEFLVYKHLSRMGYCLYRYSRDRSCTTDNCVAGSRVEDVEDNVKMEEDNGVIVEVGPKANNNTSEDMDDIIDLDAPAMSTDENRKSLKRTYSTSLEDDNASTESDEVMDSDIEHWNQVCIASMDEDSCLHGTKVEPGGYTVDEADSDVEIVDEVIYTHGGVEIQEIAHTAGCLKDNFLEMHDDEPVPSTSRGVAASQVVVDLVSSDDEEQDMRSYGSRIWSKFIPNSKLIFGVPPSTLIPHNMPDADKIYELDLKDKSDVSDLELEFLVDEVSLNDDRYGTDPSDNSHNYNLSGSKSWKDWRQSVFREARNVMNDSLLASSEYINGEAATKKLFLWNETQNEAQAALRDNKIVFEMYGPGGQGFSRLKASEEDPSYYIFITRHDEPVPDFGIIGTSVDGVPILIAIVCDSGENDVVFVTADRSPLSSLF